MTHEINDNETLIANKTLLFYIQIYFIKKLISFKI